MEAGWALGTGTQAGWQEGEHRGHRLAGPSSVLMSPQCAFPLCSCPGPPHGNLANVSWPAPTATPGTSLPRGWCHSGSAPFHTWGALLGLQADPQPPWAQHTWDLPSYSPIHMPPDPHTPPTGQCPPGSEVLTPALGWAWTVSLPRDRGDRAPGSLFLTTGRASLGADGTPEPRPGDLSRHRKTHVRKRAWRGPRAEARPWSHRPWDLARDSALRAEQGWGAAFRIRKGDGGARDVGWSPRSHSRSGLSRAGQGWGTAKLDNQRHWLPSIACTREPWGVWDHPPIPQARSPPCSSH